ncbi:MAG TPA: ABC transporter ATP-binding protein [Verrucomicrobiae bacterium]
MPLLQLDKVAKSYPAAGPNGAIAELPILSGINLTLERGESLAVIGPSGSGKSTLLNIIGTLDRPSSGSVRLGDQELTSLNDLELAEVRNRKIGFIFQGHHLLPQCSVLENVLIPTLASSDKELRSSAPARARELLGRVGLGARLEHRPGQLSGGERQRVAVVRALINNPILLLADEPTGALDRHSAQNLSKLLVELNRERNVTLIVVTHALDLAAKMQRTMEIREGKLQ